MRVPVWSRGVVSERNMVVLRVLRRTGVVCTVVQARREVAAAYTVTQVRREGFEVYTVIRVLRREVAVSIWEIAPVDAVPIPPLYEEGDVVVVVVVVVLRKAQAPFAVPGAPLLTEHHHSRTWRAGRHSGRAGVASAGR